ncbi:MAG: transketolase, partial [Bdellovibrionaceae bacterium]|nr:transketolase [Pseudobdellovibrionaceae bacterium]
IKGFGVKKTMESSSGGHGFPLKSPTELSAFIAEIYGGQPFPDEFKSWIQELIDEEARLKALGKKDSGEKIQKGVSAALIKARKEGLPVISVISDLPGSTGVAEFRKAYPEASIDVGVAEANMISSAAGLSKLGFIPVVDTFAQFGVTKGALPHIMASLSHAPMIAIYSHTGFQDAADGASHQALSYYAMMASIPHVDCYALSCSEEAEHLVYQAVIQFRDKRIAGEVPHSKIFFLGRENFPRNYGAEVKYRLGSSQILRDQTQNGSRNVLIIAVGSMVPQALMASDELKSLGVGTIVLHPSTLNSLDESCVLPSVKRCEGRIVTIEDHQLICGYGQFLSHQLTLRGVHHRMKSLAVCGEFGRSAYTAMALYEHYGLGPRDIVKAAQSLLG